LRREGQARNGAIAARTSERVEELPPRPRIPIPFHVFLDGETITGVLSEYDLGLFVGLLIGEGSFGGDGKQPQITVRMHTRHEALFRWLEARFPDSRLYGPYHHGGRSYYQWMARGTVLVRDVLPLLEGRLGPEVDAHAAGRLVAMTERYAAFIRRERARLAEGDGPAV
jgi:hypothetical protein